MLKDLNETTEDLEINMYKIMREEFAKDTGEKNYIVKKGDCLWSIAEEQLKGAEAWLHGLKYTVRTGI